MTTEPSPRAEQIQANVAAALSRLRGEPAQGAMPAPQAAMPAPQAAMPAPQAAADPVREQILTGDEPLFDVDAAPANTAGLGAPDRDMALGTAPAGRHADEAGAPPQTAFERLTGLKPAAAEAADQQPDLLRGIGMVPPPLAELPDAETEIARRRRLRNRLILGAAAIALLGGFWILSGGDAPEGEVPVIAADSSPERVKPEEEGGLDIPNQDVAILNNGLESNAPAGGETVLPAPEEPVAPPPPAAPAVAVPSVAAPSVAAPDVAAIPSVPAPAPADLSAPDENAAPTIQAAAPEQAAAPAAQQDTAAASASVASSGAVAAAPVPTPAPAGGATAETGLPKVTAAIQPVPGGKVRIQLAAVKSEDGARAEWSRLQRTHPAILGGLELHIERFEKSPGDVYYRVQAGPLGDKAAARQICADLKQKNQACIVAN